MTASAKVYCINCAKELELVDGEHWHPVFIVKGEEIFLCGPDCWNEWADSPDRQYEAGEVVG